MTNNMSKQCTVDFDPQIYNALRLKAESSNRSVSEVVNEAVELALLEDEADLAAFDERAAEPILSHASFLNQLHLTTKFKK